MCCSNSPQSQLSVLHVFIMFWQPVWKAIVFDQSTNRGFTIDYHSDGDYLDTFAEDTPDLGWIEC